MKESFSISFDVISGKSDKESIDLGNISFENIQILDFRHSLSFFCAVSDSRDNVKALSYKLSESLNDIYLFIYLHTVPSNSILLGVSNEWLQKYLTPNFSLYEHNIITKVSNVLKKFSLSHSVITSRHLIFQKQFDSTNFKSLLLEAYSTQFIHSFLLSLDAELKNESPSSFKLSDLKKIKDIEYEITKNLSKSTPTIKEIAEMAGMSVSKFKILFKEVYGESPHQYIIDKKLHYAKELLQTGQYSITQVSYKIGFSYPSGFTRLFKKRFQQPPTALFS